MLELHFIVTPHEEGGGTQSYMSGWQNHEQEGHETWTGQTRNGIAWYSVI